MFVQRGGGEEHWLNTFCQASRRSDSLYLAQYRYNSTNEKH